MLALAFHNALHFLIVRNNLFYTIFIGCTLWSLIPLRNEDNYSLTKIGSKNQKKAPFKEHESSQSKFYFHWEII